MARPGWFNENRNRSFPFLQGTVHQPVTGPITLRNLPNDVIVDAGFLAGQSSGLDPAQHDVFLQRIRRTANTFFFDFASDAPGLFGVFLTFTRMVGDPVYLTEHIDVAEVNLNSISASFVGCDDSPLSGYLVTGDIDSLATFLPGDGEVDRISDDATMEPGTTQSLAGAYVTSFSLTNADRTRVTAPDGCPPIIWPFPVNVIHINQTQLTGEILLKAGYNSTICHHDNGNTLAFGATVAECSEGPCDEIPTFVGEVPPTGSIFLSGGPACNEVLRSINGKGGPQLELRAGLGVSLTEVPLDHEIIIDVDLHGMAACRDTP